MARPVSLFDCEVKGSTHLLTPQTDVLIDPTDRDTDEPGTKTLTKQCGIFGAGWENGPQRAQSHNLQAKVDQLTAPIGLTEPGA